MPALVRKTNAVLRPPRAHNRSTAPLTITVSASATDTTQTTSQFLNRFCFAALRNVNVPPLPNDARTTPSAASSQITAASPLQAQTPPSVVSMCCMWTVWSCTIRLACRMFHSSSRSLCFGTANEIGKQAGESAENSRDVFCTGVATQPPRPISPPGGARSSRDALTMQASLLRRQLMRHWQAQA